MNKTLHIEGRIIFL
ncbi:rCG55901 [Rattus norvegicus]|uniref:RCG55901 n=1 Tax=Rattus norvegicus TaxID=10116 RepID=A6JM64_RAT|nr:rCG55901 [Rattus norvegicus]